MSVDLTKAREALAQYDLPRCGCPFGASMDDFGAVTCPECDSTYQPGGNSNCPACGWTADFVCDRPADHEREHGAGYHSDGIAEHLRTALAAVDALTAERDEALARAERAELERVKGGALVVHRTTGQRGVVLIVCGTRVVMPALSAEEYESLRVQEACDPDIEEWDMDLNQHHELRETK